MRNAMQLKAIINNIAKEKGIRPQLALQNYMLERFLERVSLSRYRDSSIMKERWEAYRKDFNYASDIEFNEVCDAVLWIMRCISA